MITCDICEGEIDSNNLEEEEVQFDLNLNGRNFQFCEECYIDLSNLITSKEFKEFIKNNKDNF